MNLSRAVMLAAVALVLGVGTVSAQTPYASDMQAGREAFEGSNFLLADRYFKGAIENAQSDGQKATALYSLAVSAFKQGKPDEAKEHASKALEISPKNNQAKRLLDEIANTPEKQVKGTKSAKNEKSEKADKTGVGQADTYTGVGPAPRKGSAPVADKATPAKEPAVQTAKEAPAKEVPPVTAVVREPRPAAKAVETVAIPAPKAADPAPAKAAQKSTPPVVETPVAAVASKPDTAAVKPDSLAAQEVAFIPSTTAPVLAAGFSAGDRSIALITGPEQPVEKSDQSIDLKRMEIGGNGVIDAFNLHSEIAIGQVAAPQSGTLLASAVPVAAPTGKRAKSSAAAISLHVWDAATVDNKHTIEMPIADASTSSAGIDALEFSRNGRRLVVAHRTGIEILDSNGLRGVAGYRFTARPRVDGRDVPTALAVSGSGLRTALTNGTKVRVTDGTSVRDIGTVGNTAIFERIAISDDGKTIAVSSGRSVRFFDHTSGREGQAMPDATNDINALAFSPTGDRLAVASGAGVKIWQLQPRKELVELALQGTAQRLAFSGDGKMMLAASEKGTRAWVLEPIVVGSVAKPEPAKPESATVVAAANTSQVTGQPGPASDAVKPPATPEPVKEASAEPVKPAKPSAELLAARVRAANRGECDKVKEFDAQIGDTGQHDACVAKAEKQRADAERAQRIVDRRLALDAVDCVRVGKLDSEIGDAPQHAACAARAEQRAKAAERNQLLGEHKQALEKGDCEAAKALDAKLALGDSKALAACAFQSLVKTGNARELYLAAAKHDADKDRVNAKQLYRAIVDRFPQDDLAIKAAERMTQISDQEPPDAKSKGRQPRR